jgi:hypothetical protein
MDAERSWGLNDAVVASVATLEVPLEGTHFVHTILELAKSNPIDAHP